MLASTAAKAAFALLARLFFAAVALGLVVAEPGGDLVPRAFKEAAVLAAPVEAILGAGVAAFEALVTPTRTFFTRRIPRVVAIICHDDPPNRNKAGQVPAGNHGRNER